MEPARMGSYLLMVLESRLVAIALGIALWLLNRLEAPARIIYVVLAFEGLVLELIVWRYFAQNLATRHSIVTMLVAALLLADGGWTIAERLHGTAKSALPGDSAEVSTAATPPSRTTKTLPFSSEIRSALVSDA